ncbi:centrosomal protein kizuna isoform X1 [Pelobates fuscus]|uniref:centrosomal protein kizuna isoform X1 n=1 Tax=Pelobates fuscus TaxID=191477 RepID=UPI002FE44910
MESATERASGFIGASEYDGRIGELQRRLRDCERKRLELENKLFQYSSSDVHIRHLKYAKLKHSLKDVCEKEKKARLRNKTFLQEIHRIESGLHDLISNTCTLQQNKMLQLSRQTEINTGADMSGRMYHPATIFMGRQMSANSSIEHCLTQRKSPQPTKSFSISDPHSVRQAAINSNLTDSCVVPANSDIQCLNKPDKIDGKTSFQISQKMPVTSIVSSKDGGTHRSEIDKPQSGKKHLLESKQSAQLSAHSLERLSPENRAGDLQNDSPSNKVEESLMYESLVPNEERFTHTSPSGSLPDACDYINKQTSDKHSACENLSEGDEQVKQLIQNEEDHEFLDSSSDLTVSFSDSDVSSADPLDKIEHKPPVVNFMKSEKNTANKGATDLNSHFTFGRHLDEESSVNRNTLSDKGFLHLLQSIEEMVVKLEPESINIYQNTDLSQSKRNHLISLCNQLKTQNVEDLEACTALVLLELQRLLKITLYGYSPSWENPKEYKSNSDEGEKPRPVSKLVQDRLLDHIAFLNDHQIFSKRDLPRSLSIILSWNDQLHQKDVSRMGEGKKNMSPDSSRETQSSVSLKSDPTGIKIHKNIPNKNFTKTAEQVNSEESQKIRDTTIQDIKHSLADNQEDTSDVSELEIPGLTTGDSNFRPKANNALSSETTYSSSEKTPLSRKEDATKKKANVQSRTVSTNMKSKAFWGESEDSSSEIEAILRPQTQHEEDDFDDFFD